MIIGIDASRATKIRKTGTEYYAEQVIYHISKIDHRNQYILFSEVRPPAGSLLVKLPKNFRWKIIPSSFLWTQIKLSWYMLFYKNKLDVLFIPSHTIPLIYPKKTVVTIHDFGFEYKPELYAKKPIGPDNIIIKKLLEIGARIATLGKYGNSEYDYHRWAMRHAVDKSAYLITDSKDTKKDAIKLYNAPPNKITTIPLAYDKKKFTTLSKTNHKKESLKLTEKLKPYLFFVSRLEEKKNVYNMLRAYINLKTAKKIPHKFVLAGMPGLGYEKIKKLILNQPENIRRDIVELGYVPDRKLPMYLQNADVFFFCTNFEGFGIPVIEAQACGIPVVCSNITSLPEIAGHGAMLADPNSVDQMANALYKVISNRKLHADLIKKGYTNIKRFSWEKCARETLNVISKAAEK